MKKKIRRQKVNITARTPRTIYAVQHDTQSFLITEFYSSLMLARHVSELTGSPSGAFNKLYLQIWYVVIRVLLVTSSRYEVVGTAYILKDDTRSPQYQVNHVLYYFIKTNDDSRGLHQISFKEHEKR